MPLSTISAVLKREGLGKLSRLAPAEPVNGYERGGPGELIHRDVRTTSSVAAAMDTSAVRDWPLASAAAWSRVGVRVVSAAMALRVGAGRAEEPRRLRQKPRRDRGRRRPSFPTLVPLAQSALLWWLVDAFRLSQESSRMSSRVSEKQRRRAEREAREQEAAVRDRRARRLRMVGMTTVAVLAVRGVAALAGTRGGGGKLPQGSESPFGQYYVSLPWRSSPPG